MEPVHPHFLLSRLQKTSHLSQSLITPEPPQKLEDLDEVEEQSSVDVANEALLNEGAELDSREPAKVDQEASSSIKIMTIEVVGADGVVASDGEIMISHNEIVMLR